MKISIIIPTYNRSKYIESSIKRLLESKIESSEIIVVDDGSTDETPSILARFGPSIRSFRQDNAGPASARNSGFSVSRGRYVTFLDSDDYLIHSGLENVIHILDKYNDINVIFGDAIIEYLDGHRESLIAKYGGPVFENLPAIEVEPGVRRLDRHEFFKTLVRRNVVFLGSMVVRREIVEHSSGFTPELFGSEDWEYCLRIATQYDYTYCNIPVAVYRQHPGGISNDFDRMGREFAKALRVLLRYPNLDEDYIESIQDQINRQNFWSAYRAYDLGDMISARDRFAACFKSHPSYKHLFYWMMSHLPAETLSSIRAFKRRVLG